MKMIVKRILCTVIAICCAMGIGGCTKKLTMSTVLEEPNFAGIVTEVYENLILVSVNEEEALYQSGDLAAVPLDVELEDSVTHFTVGDEVRVYYDGTVEEKYPVQIYNVYAIMLVNEDDASAGEGGF